MARKNAKKQEAPVVITELELVGIETTRMQLSDLRKQVRKAEAKLEQSEKSVIDRLKAGAQVLGSRTAAIQAGVGPCRPKWQELHIKHMEAEHGQAAALTEQKAKEAYPAKPTEELVIGVSTPSAEK
jgi:chromosome segregation ATPase